MRAVGGLLAVGLAALISLGGVAAGQWVHHMGMPVAGGASAPAPATAGSVRVLGASVQNPPADWPVRGCEVMAAAPGGTAASLGLVGARQRIDPVGDVIAMLQDATNGSAPQPTPDCAALAAAVARTRDGDAITIEYYHRVAGLPAGRWVVDTACGTVGNGSAIACPAPLTGTMTSSGTGNRIRLTIEIRGPKASATYPAVLDTGADETIMPDGDLRRLGFKPVATTITGGLVPGTDAMSFVYRLPSSDVLVQDQGRLVPLAAGTLVVWGMPQESGVWLGPNILTLGVKLTTSGRRWTLDPACAP